ncbi:MAG: efflux RND transporter permease subunit [Acidobacteria bacterium]|nr:efflux RND transporter permease subunit [Acidobacteriota bacterium]
MTLPELAIKRPITALVMLLSLFVMGLIALKKLPLAFMPDMEKRQIFVIANYPNSTPQAMERLVVRPLEDELSSVPGLKWMWSNCDANGGRINLNFDFSKDMGIARTEIRERIERARANLPADIERIQISDSWNPRETGETIMESRISSGRDLSKDYPLLERKIIKPLERIPGVAAVILDGVNPREVKINLNMDAMRRHRLRASEIYTALAENNVDQSVGIVRTQETKETVRTLGAFEDVSEIAALPIPGHNLKIGDVAEVTYKEPPLEYGRHLNGQFAVALSIAKESTANTIEVSEQVRNRIHEMGSDPELQGIDFLIWQDQGQEILKTIGDLKETGWIGAVLAAIILFIFLKRTSTTLIALTCIPFSLVVACGILWAQGKTLNTITLLGLIVGIGMLVDNAVVVIENIDRYQKKGLRQIIAAHLGAREVSVAVIAATFTSVIVFLPLIFSKPTEINIILKELAITVSITLLASLLISQTLIPLAAVWFIKADRVRKPGRIMSWLENRYQTLLRYSLGHRWLAPTVGLLVIGSAYFPFSKIEKNFETNPSEMFVGLRYIFSENLSLSQKETYVNQVEAALIPYLADYQVDSYYSFWSDRFTTTRLYMKPGFTHEEHMNTVRADLRQRLPVIAGMSLEVQDNIPFWDRTRGKRVGAQLIGPDTEVLANIARSAKLKLEEVPGLFDINTDAEGSTVELHTEIDRDRARAYGVPLNRASDVVELTYRGRRLPRFKGPDGEVEMRLTLDEQEEESLDQLRNLPVGSGSNFALPLEQVAEFHTQKAPDQIRRNNKATGVWVGAKFNDGKKEEIQALVQTKLSDIDLPYGYRWDFSSGRRQQQESESETLINALLALGLIFAVMAGLFESIRQAAALMVSLPFAISGALWALYLTGTDLDQPAIVGMFLLLGIVVNNGIVMIEHINFYRRKDVKRADAMVRGGKERLRPVLMTALTTLFGLVPMVVQKPALAGVYYYSMAYVLMGGLLVSTVLTVLLLPVTICFVEDFFQLRKPLKFKPKPFQASVSEGQVT